MYFLMIIKLENVSFCCWLFIFKALCIHVWLIYSTVVFLHNMVTFIFSNNAINCCVLCQNCSLLDKSLSIESIFWQSKTTHVRSASQQVNVTVLQLLSCLWFTLCRSSSCSESPYESSLANPPSTIFALFEISMMQLQILNIIPICLKYLKLIFLNIY